MHFVNLTPLFTLAPGVRLRREHFGGIAFSKNTGTLVELDRPAFALLARMEAQGPCKEEDLAGGSEESRGKLLRELLQLGILCQVRSHPKQEPVRDELPLQWPKTKILTAPETVHWAITYRCNNSCPDCYAARYRDDFKGELTTTQAFRLVDKLAGWGVFQLSIGGGEPLLRADLAPIVSRAKEKGLVVHITTGMNEIADSTLQTLAGSVTALQIGINHGRLLTKPEEETPKLQKLVGWAERSGMVIGANLMLSKTVLTNFPRLCKQLQAAGFENLTLLRYKPPATLDRWEEEQPKLDSLVAFQSTLWELAEKNPQLNLRLDCALSFFASELSPAASEARGLRGCVAGERILALTPQASAFPCSQLIAPSHLAGNLLTDDPTQIWQEAKVLKQYRAFRQSPTFRDSQCGICEARVHCGGCRVFAADSLGGDPLCPLPQLPPLQQLGKIGRKLDLAKYLESAAGITVGKYMERYVVGQKCALSELRNNPDLT